MDAQHPNGQGFKDGFAANLGRLMRRARLAGPTDLAQAIPDGRVSTVHGWLIGDSVPRPDQLSPLSAALGCSVFELFVFEGTGAPDEVLALVRTLAEAAAERRLRLLALLREAVALAA